MRALNSRVRLRGEVIAELFGPDGELKSRQVTHNLVTANGDQYLAKKIYSAPTAMANMKLCSDNVVATKTGAGSYPGSNYVSGSAKACDESSPKQGATADIVQWIRTWAAGEATGTIRRVAIVDNLTDAAEADATHTMSVAVFGADIPKGAADTLKVTWNVTWLGA